jgi:hypothetical protein
MVAGRIGLLKVFPQRRLQIPDGLVPIPGRVPESS